MNRIQRLMKLHKLLDKAGEGGSDTGGTGTTPGAEGGTGTSASPKEGGEGGVEDAQAFGHDFLADAVAGDDCDSVLHGAGLMSDEKRQLSGHQINYNPA